MSQRRGNGRELEGDIRELENRILEMGALVENAIDVAVAALLQAEAGLAASVIRRDNEIDRREVEVEEMCLRILETERPTGSDLRLIAGVLKINLRLERMADLAVNIAESAQELVTSRAAPLELDLEPLTDLTQRMVREGLNALVTRDVDLAHRVRGMDDEADRLFADLRDGAVGRMKKDPTRIDSVTSILGALRDLERIADQATNVAEDVVYLVDGEIIRHRDSGSGRGSSV